MAKAGETGGFTAALSDMVADSPVPVLSGMHSSLLWKNKNEFDC